MLANMTPEEYEQFCGKIFNLVWYFIVVVALSLILTCINAILLYYVWSFPIPINVYMAAPPAIILSMLFVAVRRLLVKYRLLHHPIIYWWIIVFGYRVPLSKLIKKSDFTNICSSHNSEQEIKRRISKIFLAENLGLFYIDFEYKSRYGDKVISENTTVCFASKRKALLFVMKIPDGGYKLD